MDSNKVKSKNKRKFSLITSIKRVIFPFVFFIDQINLFFLFYRMFNFFLRKLRIKKKYNKELNYRIISKIFESTFIDKSVISKDYVVFFNMIGSESNFNFSNMLLAKSLKSKNLEPIFIVCNSSFSICNHERINKTRKFIPLFCKECFFNYAFYEKKTGIKTIYLNDFFEDTETLKNEIIKIDKFSSIQECNNYSFNNIPIGVLSRTSILRYFQKGAITETEPELLIFKKFLKNGIKAYLIFENMFWRLHGIKYVILSNGALSYERILGEVCINKNVNYLTQERYLSENSIIFKKNGIAIHLDYKKEFNNFIKINKIKEEDLLTVQKKIEQFNSGRYNSKNEFTPEKNVRYVGLFTNLNFDTYVLDRNPIFESMLDWVKETIVFWEKEIQDIKLIIRAHPGEVKIFSPSTDFVSNILTNQLNPNIIFIDSTEKFNSYELFDIIEYGICYSSTIGLELALKGIPVISVGESLYKDFVINPNNKDNYFNTIMQLNNKTYKYKVETNKMLEYLYYIYFVRTMEIEGFRFNRQEGRDEFILKDINVLLEKNKQLLDSIYNCLNEYPH